MNAIDQNAILDSYLAEWHEWAKGEQHARGYGNSSAGLSGYRPSRQHNIDDLYVETDKSTMQTIDFHVGEMDEPYRAAIYMEAKNLAAGRHVFRSPRVPAGIEGMNIMKVARLTLINRLVNGGVL